MTKSTSLFKTARRTALASMFAGLLVLGAASPVLAEIIVLGGKGAIPAAGTVLKDDATLEVPAGASINVLLPSGAMRTIAGPSKTPVRDLSRGEKADQGLWSKVTGLVQTGKSDSATGAVRSALPGAGAGRAQIAFSWADVPIDAEGDYCIEKSTALSLTRPVGGKALRATVVDLATNSRGEALFAEGQTRANWPANLLPKTGKFALVVPDRGLKQIQLRIIDPLPSRENAIRVLHGQGCEVQMRALLRELMTSASLPTGRVQ